jgi:hypothetical protein
MGGKCWTLEEDEILISLFKQGLGPDKMYKSNKLPGRSYASILQRCIKFKLGTVNKKWNAKETWLIYLLYKRGLNVHEIADLLPNRSKSAVNGKLSRDGLYYHKPRCEKPCNLNENETLKTLLSKNGKGC